MSNLLTLLDVAEACATEFAAAGSIGADMEDGRGIGADMEDDISSPSVGADLKAPAVGPALAADMGTGDDSDPA